MKLIFCPVCQDIVRLRRKPRQCDCGKSWGGYEDGLNAVYGGDAIPMGIDNHTFMEAYHKYSAGLHKLVYTAFFIHDSQPTFRYTPEDFSTLYYYHLENEGLSECDCCKDKMLSENLIWITSDDFQPKEGEELLPCIFRLFDALCPSCYNNYVAISEEAGYLADCKEREDPNPDGFVSVPESNRDKDYDPRMDGHIGPEEKGEE
jgi:hypothetical protein